MSDVDARYLGLTANQLAKIATDLKVENAELRKKLEQWHRFINGIELPEYPFNRLRWDELERENDKLRDLVKDLNKWLWNGADCTECPFTAKCDLNAAFESDLHAHICIGWSEIHDRMRELGIEVPE